MKQNRELSRESMEWKGERQGHKRSSGHFRSYINPCLTAAYSSELGFYIGPVCISVICIAYDTYALSGNPRSLQGLINIIGHYGRRYRLIFGPDKTKVTITGSKQDMNYYKDINIWSLYGEPLNVSEDNDHLGLIVSDRDEEIKNIDKNIKAARDSLFSFLGNVFSHKCKLSPSVQFHTWQVFIKPVLRSRLAALPIRPQALKPLTTFHHKVLRSILKLSKYSPIPPLYFLLGEIPIEASLHLDILALFWNIWSNPHTKSYEVLLYLLAMADDKSVTWTAHVRILFKLYNLPDPLQLLAGQPWTKTAWLQYTKTSITCYHEKILRAKAENNRKLKYLNVKATGLSGRPHPMLAWVKTTQDVDIVGPHIKMLAGDYLSYENLSLDRGVGPHCRLCQLSYQLPAPAETLEHLLTRCRATSNVRSRILPEILNTLSKYHPNNELLSKPTHSKLTQFLLDSSSLNLQANMRLAPNQKGFTDITKLCSSLIFAVHNERKRQLKGLQLL